MLIVSAKEVRVEAEPRHGRLSGTGRGAIESSDVSVRHNLVMSPQSHTDRRDQRRRFVADPDALVALSVEVEQLSDPDVRSLVIRHEHPEFEEALKQGRRRDRGPGRADEPTFASHDA